MAQPIAIPHAVAQYEDLATMLREQDLDLVDVAVTEDQHFTVARQALEAGADVIVEKPFVLDGHHAEELVTLSERLGRHVYVGQILRFDPRYRVLHENLRSGQQALRHLSLQRNFQVAAHEVYGRFHPFYTACVHDIDLAIWLVGQPVRRVLAVSSSWLNREYPDVVIGILEWENGLRAVIQNVWHLASGCPYGFEFETKVFADEATYVIRNEPVLQVWGAHEHTSAPEMFFWPIIEGERQGALVRELRHYADCSAAGTASPILPLDEVVAGIRAADALVRSSASGRWEVV